MAAGRESRRPAGRTAGPVPAVEGGSTGVRAAPPAGDRAACPLCGRPEPREVLATAAHDRSLGESFRVVACRRCGHHYLDPWPSADRIAGFYATTGGGTAASDGGTTPRGALRRWWHTLNYRSPAEDLVDRGPVLDVGCHSGALLARFAGRGVEAEGIEPGAAGVAACRARGLHVIPGTLDEAALEPGRYRYVILSHVLEHLPDPSRALAILRAAMRPGGRLVILVPNRESAMRYLFGRRWHGWDPPYHLHHFDRGGLASLCEAADLRLVSNVTGGHPEDFTRSLALLASRGRRHLLLRAALWPVCVALGWLGRGAHIVLVAEKPGAPA